MAIFFLQTRKPLLSPCKQRAHHPQSSQRLTHRDVRHARPPANTGEGTSAKPSVPVSLRAAACVYGTNCQSGDAQVVKGRRRAGTHVGAPGSLARAGGPSAGRAGCMLRTPGHLFCWLCGPSARAHWHTAQCPCAGQTSLQSWVRNASSPARPQPKDPSKQRVYGLTTHCRNAPGAAQSAKGVTTSCTHAKLSLPLVMLYYCLASSISCATS